jgi:hypothetical protein
LFWDCGAGNIGGRLRGDQAGSDTSQALKLSCALYL